MEKLYATSFLEGNLFLYPNNQEWVKCGNVPLISSEELYEGQNYQALNLAEGFGYLRKVSVGELTTTNLGKHDIIILNGIPNDVSVVAGIITTEFQTPLSHINILSHNRGTPNMALRDGWTNPKFDSLIGELVYLKVDADSFTIRKALPEEATEFWNKNEPQTIRVLEKDETTSGLIDLSVANYSSVNLIGGKAANFVELLKLNQIILYTYSLSNSRDFTIEYLSHSKIGEFNGQNVLTNDELYQLGAYCLQIKHNFFYEVPHNCNCLFDDFGLDIEFKIDSPGGKRKLYIKQVRLYN